MSIGFDTKTKKYYCQFRYKDWHGNVKATTKRGFKTKREAKEYEFNFKLKSCASCDLNFSDLAKEYLEYVKDTKRPSTYTNYSIVINKHILPYFCNFSVSSITINDIRKWQAVINNNKRLGDYYKKSIMTFMKLIFNFAVKYYGLPSNPTSNADSMGHATKRTSIIDVEEFYSMLSYAPKDELTVAIKLLFLSGMRIGELLALKREDVHIDYIEINKTFNEINGTIGPPKTKSSERFIYIPEQMLVELLSLPDNPDGFLFSRRNSSFYRRRVKALAYAAGINKKVTLHTLRHSCASLLLHNGVSVAAVSEWLGHSNPSITMAIYVHALKADTENVKELLKKTSNCIQKND